MSKRPPSMFPDLVSDAKAIEALLEKAPKLPPSKQQTEALKKADLLRNAAADALCTIHRRRGGVVHFDPVRMRAPDKVGKPGQFLASRCDEAKSVRT